MFDFLFSYFLTKRRLKSFSSRGALENWQRKKLNQLYKFLLRSSPFYKGLKKNDFKVIDKDIWMLNFNKINTRGINRDHAESIAIKSEETRDFSKKISDISVGLSTGTSGNRGIFLVSDQERNFWAANILAKTLDNGLLQKTNIAFFLRADNNLYQSLGKSRNIYFEFFDLLKNIELHFERLNQMKVDILVAPASVLKLIAEAKKLGFLKINPKKIISVAEVLEENDKEYIEKIFALRVDQIYQATEGFLAFTCKQGSLHLNEDLIYFEKEWLDDKYFFPIITDFTRKTQPIVRYRLNDVLGLSKNQNCNCGCLFTVIEKIIGRSDDILYAQDQQSGKIKNFFPDYVSRIIVKSSDKIKDYRVNQVKLNKLEIFLLLEEKFLEEVSLIVKNHFDDYCLNQGLKFFDLDIKILTIKQDGYAKTRRVKRAFTL